ncbi:MAG: hypothetical protein MJY50_00270 [Bacteroidales bacterium]|nr:hypothetical protein [Bacteroidales bacterium]
MQRFFHVFALILCLAVSCQKYDDSLIRKDISSLQEQVASLTEGRINFTSYDAVTVNLLDTMDVILPEDFKKSDFAAFTAEMKSGDGVVTKAGDNDDWKVKAIAPEFDAQGVLVKNPFVIFTRIPYEKTDAVINVSIIDNKGSRSDASRVIYSGNYDKRVEIFNEWDALFESDMQKWDELQRMEFVIWYMMSLSEDQKEEDYNEFVNSFVASHSDLIARSLLIDRADPAAESLSQMYKEEMDEAGGLDEDEEEDNEEYMGEPLSSGLGMIDTGAKFYNWMGVGHRGWGLKGGLPDNRKVCHVTLPAAIEALSEKPIIPSEVGRMPALVLFRLFRYQNVNMDYMFDRGVRVFDFHVGMHEGALHGYSSIFPCQAKLEDEMNVLTGYLNKYPSEFAVLIVTAAGPSLNAWDECHRFFYNYSQSHPGLFIPFRKDLTVGNARHHIILLWTDEEWEDTSIPKFGAVIGEKETGGDGEENTDNCIKVWNNSTNKWEVEAPLWIQDIEIGEVASNDDASNKARAHTDQMLKYVDDFKAQACMKGDCTWSINYYDKVMWWPFTGVPSAIKRIAEKLGITRYPDSAWSANYLHYEYSNRLDAKFYRNRYNAPGGIVYLNFAAASKSYGPFRVIFPVKVFGRNAVAYTLCMNGPCKMPYE